MISIGYISFSTRLRPSLKTNSSDIPRVMIDSTFLSLCTVVRLRMCLTQLYLPVLKSVFTIPYSRLLMNRESTIIAINEVLARFVDDSVFSAHNLYTAVTNTTADREFLLH